MTIPSETTFWLIRHPEPEASASGRCYGSLDMKLSEAGIRQAHEVAEALQAEPLAAIYASPRQRCVEAAEILAGATGCPLRTVDALRELDFGAFEGRTYDEIAALYPEVYRQWMESPTEVQFPGGEGFSQMRSRVLAAAADLLGRHNGQTVALVTHGGAIRILLAEALCMPAANLFRLGQRYAAINRIRYQENIPIVDLMNGVPRCWSAFHGSRTGEAG